MKPAGIAKAEPGFVVTAADVGRMVVRNNGESVKIVKYDESDKTFQASDGVWHHSDGENYDQLSSYSHKNCIAFKDARKVVTPDPIHLTAAELAAMKQNALDLIKRIEQMEKELA